MRATPTPTTDQRRLRTQITRLERHQAQRIAAVAALTAVIDQRATEIANLRHQLTITLVPTTNTKKVRFA